MKYNSASQGGGIFAFNSHANIDSSEILCNNASRGSCSLHLISGGGNGGGIYAYDSYDFPSQVVRTTISFNYASGNGGGWYMFAVASSISSCTLSDNNSAGSGGGLFLSTTSIESPTIQNCTVVRNTASKDGGGIYLDTALFQGIQNSVYSSKFNGNSAGGSGGGLYVSGSQKTVIVDSDIENNTAHINGGGIHVYDSSPEFVNSVFSDNTAKGKGGGLFLSVVTSYLDSPTLLHLEVSGNKCGKRFL